MIYVFKHSITEEVIEVSMPMKEYKPYMGENGDDPNWKRVYNVPQVNAGESSIAKMNPHDSYKFLDKTSKLRGKVGEIQDLAKELSDKRAAQSDTGEDPLKRKHFDNYQKKTGKKHLHDKKDVVKLNGVTIDYTAKD